MALSDNKFSNYKPSGGLIWNIPAAVDIIYRGGLTMINAAGYAAPAGDTANCFLAGVALDEVDNSGGSQGDESVRVDIGGAAIKVTHEDGSMAQANVGDIVVLEADDEVTSAGTGTQDIHAGRIIEIVNATTVWVVLAPYGSEH